MLPRWMEARDLLIRPEGEGAGGRGEKKKRERGGEKGGEGMRQSCPRGDRGRPRVGLSGFVSPRNLQTRRVKTLNTALTEGTGAENTKDI